MKSIQHWTYINTKVSTFFYLQLFIKIRITAGLTSILEVAAVSSPTRIAYKLNKDTCLSNNAVLYKLFKIKLTLTQNKYKFAVVY